MENKKLVRISVSSIFAIATLASASLIMPSEVEAQTDGTGYRFTNYSDYSCSGSGNCLPTITIKQEK